MTTIHESELELRRALAAERKEREPAPEYPDGPLGSRRAPDMEAGEVYVDVPVTRTTRDWLAASASTLRTLAAVERAIADGRAIDVILAELGRTDPAATLDAADELAAIVQAWDVAYQIKSGLRTLRWWRQ